MKWCTGPCGRLLETWMFYVDRKAPDGLSYKCITCSKKDADERSHRNRIIYLENKYNMYPGQYTETLKQQNEECAFPSCHSKKLVVDHNHKARKFRALLCQKHNVGLGNFGDDAKILQEAIEYLEKYNV